MKKKIVLLGLMLQASSSMFAQTANSRSDINSMLSSWLIPAIGLLMLGGFIGITKKLFAGRTDCQSRTVGYPWERG